METFLSTHNVNTIWLRVSKTNCQKPNRVSVPLRQHELNLLVLLRELMKAGTDLDPELGQLRSVETAPGQPLATQLAGLSRPPTQSTHTNHGQGGKFEPH